MSIRQQTHIPNNACKHTHTQRLTPPGTHFTRSKFRSLPFSKTTIKKKVFCLSSLRSNQRGTSLHHLYHSTNPHPPSPTNLLRFSCKTRSVDSCLRSVRPSISSLPPQCAQGQRVQTHTHTLPQTVSIALLKESLPVMLQFQKCATEPLTFSKGESQVTYQGIKVKGDIRKGWRDVIRKRN